MKNYSLSVIIPAYNEGMRISNCIESVLPQVTSVVEIIIIDDGSTDNTYTICKSYEAMYPNTVRVLHKENGGLSSARNYGLDHAKGEYITFLDSDDYLDRDYIKTLLNVIVETNSDVVISGQKKVSESGKVLEVIHYPVDKYPNCILRRMNISGKIYRLDYINENLIRFPLGKLYEDNVFNFMALFLTDRFVILPYEGYNQVIHEGSITTRKISIEDLPLIEYEKAFSYLRNHANKRTEDIFEYTVLSFFTYFIFKAMKSYSYIKMDKGRTSDIKAVETMCDFSIKMLNTYFPEYYKNRYLSILKDKELTVKQKVGVRFYVFLCRTKLLKCFANLYYRF